MCGRFEPLTFEHVPPKRCFNKKQRFLRLVGNGIFARTGEHTSFRRGTGFHSFCERCNAWTARWYGDAFADWTVQGQEYLDKIREERRVYIPFTIKPLNVIKQIATMVLAVSGSGTDLAPLQRFVGNVTAKSFPHPCRAYTYLNREGAVIAPHMMAVDTAKGRFVNVVAEISVPPLGYCVVADDEDSRKDADEKNLCDITRFGDYEFEQLDCVWLKLAQLRPGGTYPMDYR